MKTFNELLKKYPQTGPRFTSFPPHHQFTGIDHKNWESALVHAIEDSSSPLAPHLSLYLHIPFCQSLCHFCGCTKEITRDKSLARPLIETMEKEWLRFERLLKRPMVLKELHLGGGSPSWLSPDELEQLLRPILNSRLLEVQNADLSIELDSRTTSVELIDRLHQLKFTRLSFGVQDTHPIVLQAISRDQSFSYIKLLTHRARSLGIEEINYDLVLGLPFQTVESIKSSLEDIVSVKPSRLALYAYAHVPDLKPSQKILEKKGLPNQDLKMQLQIAAKDFLTSHGYVEIGMDHYALESDPLALAMINGKLHRNFMGYTTFKSQLLIGLGPSAISETSQAYAQNEKNFLKWKAFIDADHWAITNGHILSFDQKILKEKIKQLMCHFQFQNDEALSLSATELKTLSQLEEDGLIQLTPAGFDVTSLGRHFIRNICVAFLALAQNIIKK